MALVKLIFLAIFIFGFVYDFVTTITTQLQRVNVTSELPEEDRRCPRCPSCSPSATREPWMLATRPSTGSSAGLPPCDDGAVASGSRAAPDFVDIELGSPDSGVGVETALEISTIASTGSTGASSPSGSSSATVGSASGSVRLVNELLAGDVRGRRLFTQEELDAAVKLAQEELLVSKNKIYIRGCEFCGVRARWMHLQFVFYDVKSMDIICI